MTRQIAFALCVIGMSMTNAFADDQPKSAGKNKIPDLVYVKMTTNFGDICLELNALKAPISVANFLKYVDDGFYNGIIFHRVVLSPNLAVIQGGGFDKEKNQRKTNPQIKNESMNGLKNERGTISMARTTEPDSATSQFFINVLTNQHLDPKNGVGYAVFGKVISGMDVVDKIGYSPTKNEGGAFGELPSQMSIIERCTRMSESETKEVNAKEEKKRSENKGKQMEVGKALVKSNGVDITKGKTTPTGLWYVDITEGSGGNPKPTSKVTVQYSVWLTDGTLVDSSKKSGQPLVIGLNQVIKGWTEGVCAMKNGGKRWLVIPPALAWAERGFGTVPPDAAVVFEIELLSFE